MNKHVKTFEAFVNADGELMDDNTKVSGIETHDLEAILKAYLACALWTEAEQLAEEVESPSDDDLHIDSKIQAYADIKKFLYAVGTAAAGIEDSDLGHDLWLSRNHHGSGFFDRGYENEVEQTLMSSAHDLGQVDLYVGDDGLLYFSNAH